MPVALVSQVLRRRPEAWTGPGSVAARPVVARRPFWPMPVLAALVVAVSFALAPSVAAAAACPSSDTSYMGNCGPQFAVPNWTDAGGWNDPAKYSTIQLADVNGDGSDELIGRSDAGLQISWFDTTLGQWRPQVDSSGNRQALTDFASPPPWQASDPHSPAQPQYYSTIQAADVDGQPGEEILGRFWDGMRTYKYSPPAGGKDIDGGSWTRIGTGGPFSDADGYGDPSLYSTIQVGRFYGGDPPVLLARQHSKPDAQSLAFYTWRNGTWSAQPGFEVDGYSDQECGQPACYLDLKAAGPPGNLGDFLFSIGAVIGRNQSGIGAFSGKVSGSVNIVDDAGYLGSTFADVASTPDCPFSTAGATGPGSGDCLGSSPSYYETLQAANVDGQPGDELLARAADGLRLRLIKDYLVPYAAGSTLTALAGAASSVPDGLWGSIRTGDIDDDGKDEVLALDGKALQAWSYDPVGNAWSQLQPSTPLALASDPWLSHPEYYSTIQTGDVDGDGRDDVIARGPSGIRTWFYDRRKNGRLGALSARGLPGVHDSRPAGRLYGADRAGQGRERDP